MNKIISLLLLVLFVSGCGMKSKMVEYHELLKAVNQDNRDREVVIRK